MKKLLPVIISIITLLWSCSPKVAPVASITDFNNGTTFGSKNLPAWAFQSNIYEVNVRQYTPEGTFNAFAKHLPRLKEMGVEILWFMPITPISVVDRKGTLGSYYAVADYKGINPEFGNLQDWKNLVNEAHRLGFKVITDWVANHSGADNHWLTAHPDFYVRDENGNPKYAFDWSDTRDLNYNNPAMRDSMLDAMKWWITETGIDGFRCDVAAEVPRKFWQPAIAELRKIKPDVFMLAESDDPWIPDAGFHVTYGWEMFSAMKKVADGSRNALSLDSVLMHQDERFVPGAIKMYFTSNHDENSWNKSDYATFPGAVHAPFAVFTQTMRYSLPLIYSGQEEPVLDSISFFYKNPIQFGKYERAPFYKALLEARKNNAALAVDASFRKLVTNNDQAIYAFIREKNDRKALVILNFSNSPVDFRINDGAIGGKALNIFTGRDEKISARQSFQLPAWGYRVYSY